MGRSHIKVMSSSNKVCKNAQLFLEPACCLGGLDFPGHSCVSPATQMIQGLELLANHLQADDLIKAYEFKKERKKKRKTRLQHHKEPTEWLILNLN